MDLLKKPRSKQSVMVICIAILSIALLAVLLVAGGVFLFTNSQNQKNMKLSFWDSDFTVETAFYDPAGNVTVVLSEISHSDDHVADDTIELRSQLETRNMPLTITDGSTSYKYEEMFQMADCALINGKLITNYVLYLPNVGEDLTLTLNGKSVALRLCRAEDITPVTSQTETAVGTFSMSTYYLGGNYSAVWCEMDTDLALVGLGVENINIRYTSDVAHRSLVADMPAGDNTSLKLVGLMSDKPVYRKESKVADSFSYDGIYFEIPINGSWQVGSISGDTTIEKGIELDGTAGLRVNMLARRSKQVLCYLNVDTNYGTLSGGSGYLLSREEEPTDKQLAYRASASADCVVVSGSSSDGEDELKLHLNSARFTVKESSGEIAFAEVK